MFCGFRVGVNLVRICSSFFFFLAILTIQVNISLSYIPEDPTSSSTRGRCLMYNYCPILWRRESCDRVTARSPEKRFPNALWQTATEDT